MRFFNKVLYVIMLSFLLISFSTSCSKDKKEVVREEKKNEAVPINEEPITEVKKQPIEIIPPVEIKPAIDRKQVAANLKSPDYDIQALQLKDIVDAGLNPDTKAIKPYVVEQVFLNVIDLVNVDSTNFDTEFSACGYFTYADSQGEEITVYTDVITRSVNGVN